ncbi:D-galactarate dehydratase [Ruegeria sediminis]|uniref:D-galactarate dehydratase n=1 Tax=Ruegeria sediminis TaxID=2583820 RepID=A0ABY2WT32_9RHOB|nr:UxaA family hydrolase [Ruegeria sediminis]TMV04222.1 D-galactarate dehydratase [Ruegeria sediminis]
MGPRGFDAIALAEADHVATVLRDIAAGEVLVVGCADGEVWVTATEDIPLGHKVALTAIDAGDPILKYGSAIGSATEAIAPGAHVHVHNLRSDRARRRTD